jgi:hypothetical protein
MDIKDEFQDLLLVYLLLHAFLQGEIMGVQSTSANSASTAEADKSKKSWLRSHGIVKPNFLGRIFNFITAPRRSIPHETFHLFSTKKERNGR